LELKNQKLLIIAPHPDDETLGCFGIIDEIKKNGGKVYVQILSLGGYTRVDSKKVTKENWNKEFQKVCSSMKIDGYDIMLYEDTIKHLDEIPQSQIIDYLEKKSKISLYKLKPTIVAIPTIFSTHQDHIIAFKTSISALRYQPKTIYPMPKIIFSYETPEYYFWSPYLEFGKFSPNFYIKLNEKQLKRKFLTLNLYKSQIKKGKRDFEKLRGIASTRGSEIVEKYAEGYHIHRFVV